MMKKKSELNNDADIYIISYPKTGRTWLKALIGSYLIKENNLDEKYIFKISNIFSIIGLPKIKIIHDDAQMKLKKSYKQLNADKKSYAGKKVLLLSREIKDTLISAYFHATKRIFVFSGSISEFIRSEEYGAMKVLTFYRQWYENRHIPGDFMLLRYEEMHKDPELVLKKVLEFFGLHKTNPDIIEYAVNFSRFENLQKIYKNNELNKNILSPRNLNDANSFKFRKGKVGSYTEYLAEEDIKYMDALSEQFGCEFIC